jgi:hypothetical protein
MVLGKGGPPTGMENKATAIKPINRYSDFSIQVQSDLPAWGVAIEAAAFSGPNGETPVDRLLVQTDMTGGDFIPLTSPVPIVTGDFKLPVRESTIKLLFCPTWEDPAGTYEGRLLLRPFVPEGMNMSTISSGGVPGLIGTDQEVQFVFDNDEIIMIQESGQDVVFEVKTTPSGREAVAQLVFSVSTNASRWHVVCDATFLEGGRQKISPARINWDRSDEYGHVVQKGNMETDVTVLEGFGPANELSSRINLVLPLSMSDIAGSYVGRIALTGVVEGERREKTDERETVTPHSGE